ncbi:MAG: transposase [Hyphomonadaceae bacterium]|nr:transposase [Hyphomonadaceae bacterium]
MIEDQDCRAFPPQSQRVQDITYSKRLYKQRNLIERFFNKLKQFRHICALPSPRPELSGHGKARFRAIMASTL